MLKHTAYVIKIFLITTHQFFIDNRYAFYASALTLNTLLAIVPLLSVSVFILTKFSIFLDFISISEDYIFKNFVPTSASAIQSYMQNFIQQAVHLPLLSIAFLVVTAIIMINTIDDTINDIWNITKRRKKLTTWLFYSFIFLIAPVVLGLSVFLTSYVVSFHFLSPITSRLIFILPIFLNAVIFSLFYIYGPNTQVEKKDGIFIGFMIALLIELARWIFALWISYFSSYKLIYGVFSILPIFIIWLYIFWSIILWGALITYNLSIYRIKN